MTEPLPPDDALVLSYVDGTMNDGERAAFAARLRAEPALRAEVDGLVALRGLLDDDTRFGATSGLDAPPPHLVDAIVRAEVAARPDAIRAAVLRAADASDAARPWWSKLSSWLVGTSLVGAGAAALLLVVTRAEAPATSPQEAKDLFAAAPAAAPAAAQPPPPAAAFAAAPGGDGAVAAAQVAPAGVASTPPPTAADGPADADDAVGAIKGAPARLAAVTRNAATQKDALAEAKPAVDEAARGAETRADDEEAAAGGMAYAKADAVAGAGPAATSAPAPAKTSPAAPVAAPAEGEARPSLPRTREEFLEKKVRAEASSSKGKSAVDSVSGMRAELERARRAQTANELLLAAEHELSIGRAAGALDLAQRAELEDRGGVLGALPVTTQVRAYAALRRSIDAARVASRLLQASAAEPAVVDALVVGADAAVAIGDRALARRLLQRALEPENRDAARRATARQRLDKLATSGDASTKAEPASTAPPR
jgi:hypothetical protein